MSTMPAAYFSLDFNLGSRFRTCCAPSRRGVGGGASRRSSGFSASPADVDANGNPPYNRRGRLARGEGKGESGAALWGVLAGGSQAGRLQLVPRRRRSPFWAPPREEESARGRRGWLRRRTPAASKVRRAGWVVFFFWSGRGSLPFKPACPCLGAPAAGLSWESSRAH